MSLRNFIGVHSLKNEENSFPYPGNSCTFKRMNVQLANKFYLYTFALKLPYPTGQLSYIILKAIITTSDFSIFKEASCNFFNNKIYIINLR